MYPLVTYFLVFGVVSKPFLKSQHYEFSKDILGDLSVFSVECLYKDLMHRNNDSSNFTFVKK